MNTDDQVAAADWVQMLLSRTPGHATAAISGPDITEPVRIGSTDGVLYSLEAGDDGHPRGQKGVSSDDL